MITTNYNLNALNALFTTAEKVADYDYVKTGRVIIDRAVIAAAIIIGVATYIITALQLFWLENGERIMIAVTRFIINLVDYSHELYKFGQETRRFVSQTANRLADSVFYTIAA
jgi:hypothetical protein